MLADGLEADDPKVDALRLEAGDESKVMTGIGHFLAEATDVAVPEMKGMRGSVGVDADRATDLLVWLLENNAIISPTKPWVTAISECKANLGSTTVWI